MGIFRRSKAEPEPLDDADAPAPATEPETPAPAVSVVVVDDDEDVRFVMTTALERDGFRVLGSAGNAEEALALVSADEKPDLLLLDLHMPDMGGLELLPLLRAQTPQTKFVVCSAITASYMLEATMDAGASAFIVKGVSAKSIAEHLHRVAGAGLAKIVRPYPLNRDY